MNKLSSGFYVASRACVSERAAMWRRLRDREGWPIISSWIDNSNEKEALDKIWQRSIAEIKRADALIVYAESSDLPLRGVFIEAGAALAFDKRILLIADCSLGSWVSHPLVTTRPAMISLIEVKEILKL